MAEQGNRPADLDEIATNAGEFEPLSGIEINDLCEELNDVMATRPECGHPACVQNWIDTGQGECVAIEELIRAGRALKMDRAGVADADTMFVAPIIAKADAQAFTDALDKFEDL